jgi:DNA topoisomerase-1
MLRYRWKTLITAGPVFPDRYLPKPYSLGGVVLSPLAEEMLYAYAPHFVKKSSYIMKPQFNLNFFSCLQQYIVPYMRDLPFPDAFSPVLNEMYTDREKASEEVKRYTAEHKDEIVKQKELVKQRYGVVMLDGKPEPLTNYMIEPPGIMLARGNSSELGLWKYRVEPEDIIINCSGTPPEPLEGHTWREVICKPDLCAAYKYYVRLGDKRMIEKAVRVSYHSSIGALADKLKFEQALTLHYRWDDVYGRVCKNIFNPRQDIQQAMLITWLVANTAIRIGGTSSEVRESGVVGASTLIRQNIDVTVDSDEKNAVIRLQFLGKDSIAFNNTYYFNQPEEIKIIKVLKLVVGETSSGNKVFSVDAAFVNSVLKLLMPGLSAKLFRPAKGTALLANFLYKAEVQKEDPVVVKVKAFKHANLQTARLLNHKRTVTPEMEARIKTHKAKMALREAEIHKKMGQLKDRIDSEANSDMAEKLFKRLQVLQDKFSASKEKLSFRETSKADALNTSLGSYLDPRAVASWCADVDCPIEKLYPKSLLRRFGGWITEVDPSFWRDAWVTEG